MIDCEDIVNTIVKTIEMDSKSDEMIASKVYRKDSFDRFGDNLCQHLLSYLSLEDRFRCECVAKQWQRLVFKTLTELNIGCNYFDDSDSDVEYIYTVNDVIFECMVKKCPNITAITFGQNIHNNSLNDFMVNLIINHCNGLRSMVVYYGCKFNCSADTMDQFFAKFAKQLTKVNGFESDDTNVKISIGKGIKLCHNMTQMAPKLFAHKFRQLFGTKDRILFPKLRELCIKDHNLEHFYPVFEVFVNNYKNQLKSLIIQMDIDNYEPYVSTVINGLSQMSGLTKLTFSRPYAMGCGPYVFKWLKFERLLTIGSNLPHLKSLQVFGYYELTNTQWTQFAQTFRRLKMLDISGPVSSHVALNILPAMNRLTHWSLDASLIEPKDVFWSELHTRYPRLQSIKIGGKLRVTNNVLNGLAKLPKIQYIKIRGHKSNRISTLSNLINGSNKLIKYEINCYGCC